MSSVKLSVVIPTLNRKDLLQQALPNLLKQRDHFELLHIIDNGQQGIDVPDDPKILLQVPGRNLGVAASWNLGISVGFKLPQVTHILAINDDIELGENQLLVIRQFIEDTPDYWFYVGQYYWSVWVISRNGAKTMEYRPAEFFDSRFYPAYTEDNDFHHRLNLINASKYLGNIQELLPKIMRNSMTAQKMPYINHERSERFYCRKWGGKPGKEQFAIPFDGKL